MVTENAARAGHGFAVIASEVKESAKQIATATGDICKRMQEIKSLAVKPSRYRHQTY